MPATWTEMKQAIELQMTSDPQRATLASKAVDGVERWLGHLAGVGWDFEIAPRGTLAALVDLRDPTPPTMPLSVADAVGQISGPKKSPLTSKFEAMTNADAG